MRDSGFRWRFTPSATEWFCLLLGGPLVFWFAWLMDDAYVYFRYVDNLLIHRIGLVWNAGECVEGFSSPLWALLLVALRSLRLNYWLVIRLVAIVSYVLFWWLACLTNRGLAARDGRQEQGRSLNLPLIYLTFTYGVCCYFSSGLESPLVNVAAAAYAAAILWPQSVALQVIIGISPLLRHELALPFLLFLGYVVAAKRRIPVPAIASCILSLGPYMVFRVWYYADPFPNAFYLKDEAWFTQGLKYVYDAVLPYQAVPYLLAAFVFYLALRHARERGAMSGGRRAAMVLMGLPVALYVVRIGGDPRHFRFLAFPFILAVLATGGLVETATAGWARRSRVYLAVGGVVFGLAAASGFPRQLQQHPLFRSRFGYKHDGFLLINDAAAHRLHPTGLTPSWRSCGDLLSWQAAKRRYAAAAAPAEPAEAGRKVWFAAEGKGQDGKPAWVVADSWCLTAYMRPALPWIHSLGLTEPFLARMRMEADRPAHKFGLHGPASEIAEIRAAHGFGIGVFDKALAGKSAVPGWIAANLPAIRLLERKAYNRHNLVENIGLALTRVPKIDPGPGGSREGAHTRPRKKRQGRAARSRPSGRAGAPASRGG